MSTIKSRRAAFDDGPRMKFPIGHALAAGAVLVATVGGSWFVTTALRTQNEASSRYGSCWTTSSTIEQTNCLSDAFVRGARKSTEGLSGTKRTNAQLKFVRSTERDAAADPRVANLCHQALHELGRAEGARVIKERESPSFPSGSTQLCTAGYVHGLSEGYLSGTPDADVAAVFPQLCHETSAREGCAHGIGHALLRARATDPPIPSARAAIRSCGALPESFPTNCMNGVYMELALRSDPTSVPSAAFVETCNAARSVTETLSCWSYLGLNLRTNDIALDATPTWCAKADLPGQFQCIEEYGRALGVESVDSCARVPGRVELKGRCIEGAISLQVGSGHVSSDDAADACRSLANSRLEELCTSAVKRYAKGRRLVEAKSS